MKFLASMQCLLWLLISNVALGESPESTHAGSVGSKPNVVVILCDDLGYGDIRAFNNESTIPVPSFDRLAMEGIIFRDAHSPSAVCTPTRYGLLCGRYPWRSPMKRGVLGGYSAPLIESDRQTVAQVMKSAGYRTGCVGKWHLGLGWQWREDPAKDINNMSIPNKKAGMVDYSQPLNYSPNDAGFDSSFIIPASLDMSPYVFIRDRRTTAIPNRVIEDSPFPAFYRTGEIAEDFSMVDALDQLTDEACGFIRNSAAGTQPFFLYFALSAPHKPVMPHDRFQDATRLGPYGNFVVQVDWTVGQVLKTLDEAGVADNTLLIVTSDNGSFMYRYDQPQEDHTTKPDVQGYFEGNHRSNGPLRGTKADIWEAGHRVPFLVRWPGHAAAGQTCDQTICHTDILATIAEAAGVEFDSRQSEDSFSFLPALSGHAMQRPPVIHQSGSGHLAIRDGQWKMVMSTGSGGREQPHGKAFERPFRLFDLSRDTAETNDLAESESEKVNELYERFLTMSHGDHLESGDRK
jgi:arylsulfatase A-like enzyme